MLNQQRIALPTILFAAAQQQIDLPRGVYIKHLDLRIAGTIDIAAGGGADGVLLNENVARLIRELTVKWDNFDLVQRMSGRDLVAVAKRGIKQPLTGVSLAAPGIGTTAFHQTFRINFARPWLVNSYETVLPPLPVSSQFKLYVNWETGVAGGVGSVAGSGAFIRPGSGTRVVTFPVAPTIEVASVSGIRGTMPWFLPVLTSLDSEQFQNANPRLVTQIVNNRRFDSVLLAVRNGQDAEGAAILNDVTFQSAGVRYIDAIRAGMLHETEQMDFAGVTDVADDTGYFFLLFADGGWLGNVVEPQALVAPRFELNVGAPAAPGVVRYNFCELVTQELLTKVTG